MANVSKRQALFSALDTYINYYKETRDTLPAVLTVDKVHRDMLVETDPVTGRSAMMESYRGIPLVFE